MMPTTMAAIWDDVDAAPYELTVVKLDSEDGVVVWSTDVDSGVAEECVEGTAGTVDVTTTK